MKKLMFLMLTSFMASTACFAQGVTASASQNTAPTSIQKTIMGVIDSVVLADQSKGVPAQVVVTGQDGKNVTLHIASAAMIHDGEMKMITLDKLLKGSKVLVRYLTLPSGVLEARSINIVK